MHIDLLDLWVTWETFYNIYKNSRDYEHATTQIAKDKEDINRC